MEERKITLYSLGLRVLPWSGLGSLELYSVEKNETRFPFDLRLPLSTLGEDKNIIRHQIPLWSPEHFGAARREKKRDKQENTREKIYNFVFTFAFDSETFVTV